MKFIDEINISIKAGCGGDGHVSFLHSHLNPLSGPDGGNGGRGGNVYLRGSFQLNSLNKFSMKRSWLAQNGGNGSNGLKTGKSGDDLYIATPLGTIIYLVDVNGVHMPIAEIIEEGQSFLIAKGGSGGQGNSAFASSVNRTPRYAQKGVKTKNLQIRLELVMIADAGLIGLPNAGKSTLLNALTNANSPAGDYAFTTLKPQLGVTVNSKLRRKVVLADLPGIIEKASENKGLGFRFLRHVKRCKVLIFVIDSSDKDPFGSLEILKRELDKAGCERSQKEQIVVWNKTDLLSTKVLNEVKQKSLKLEKTHSFFVSALKNENLEDLIDVIDNIIDNSEHNYSTLSKNSLYRDYDFTNEPIGLELKKLKKSYWKVSGSYIEKIISESKNSSLQKEISKSLDIESVRNFLLAKGVRTGDILLIDNEEYFWS